MRRQLPGSGRGCSGYLVTCEGTPVWLDCRPGHPANLQLHVPIEDLDAVVLTHEHPDHWSDLRALGVACRWMVGATAVPVYAQTGLRPSSACRGGGGPRLARTVRRSGASGRCAVFSSTDHPVPTLAVRIDGGGRSLGYSADSGPAWGLRSLGPGSTWPCAKRHSCPTRRAPCST